LIDITILRNEFWGGNLVQAYPKPDRYFREPISALRVVQDGVAGKRWCGWLGSAVAGCVTNASSKDVGVDAKSITGVSDGRGIKTSGAEVTTVRRQNIWDR
jgi:hypothetical protein